MRKLLSTLSVFIRLRKKEAEKRTDEKEATKLDQRNFNDEYIGRLSKYAELNLSPGERSTECSGLCRSGQLPS